jgi:hypothetical protein
VGQGLGTLLGDLSTQTADGRRVLRGTPSVNGFLPATDAYYDILRQVERTVEDRRSAG